MGTSTTKRLTGAQITHYRQHGYVSPITGLSPAEAADARAKLEAHEAERGHPIDAIERSKSFLLFTWVDAIMRNERLLDSVEDLIGPNILCWNSIFWIKEANTASFVGWHQDLTYWGLDNDELVSVWVALSPASEAAGCMSVLPGSHLELLDHVETYHADNLLSRGQELTIDVVDRNPAAMPLEPGQASFHNVKAAHGSGPNSTDDRRIGLSLHYMPTHTKQLLADWDSAALVRGVDEFNHFEHCPRPQADLHPDAVAFHNKASKTLRNIVYAGAEQNVEPTL
jgi:non-haem Fe2+, alpha-ketoglutarate-dependent halogenase